MEKQYDVDPSGDVILTLCNPGAPFVVWIERQSIEVQSIKVQLQSIEVQVQSIEDSLEKKKKKRWTKKRRKSKSFTIYMLSNVSW